MNEQIVNIPTYYFNATNVKNHVFSKWVVLKCCEIYQEKVLHPFSGKFYRLQIYYNVIILLEIPEIFRIVNSKIFQDT